MNRTRLFSRFSLALLCANMVLSLSCLEEQPIVQIPVNNNPAAPVQQVVAQNSPGLIYRALSCFGYIDKKTAKIAAGVSIPAGAAFCWWKSKQNAESEAILKDLKKIESSLKDNLPVYSDDKAEEIQKKWSIKAWRQDKYKTPFELLNNDAEVTEDLYNDLREKRFHLFTTSKSILSPKFTKPNDKYKVKKGDEPIVAEIDNTIPTVETLRVVRKSIQSEIEEVVKNKKTIPNYEMLEEALFEACAEVRKDVKEDGEWENIKRFLNSQKNNNPKISEMIELYESSKTFTKDKDLFYIYIFNAFNFLNEKIDLLAEVKSKYKDKFKQFQAGYWMPLFKTVLDTKELKDASDEVKKKNADKKKDEDKEELSFWRKRQEGVKNFLYNEEREKQICEKSKEVYFNLAVTYARLRVLQYIVDQLILRSGEPLELSPSKSTNKVKTAREKIKKEMDVIIKDLKDLIYREGEYSQINTPDYIVLGKLSKKIQASFDEIVYQNKTVEFVLTPAQSNEVIRRVRQVTEKLNGLVESYDRGGGDDGDMDILSMLGNQRNRQRKTGVWEKEGVLTSEAMSSLERECKGYLLGLEDVRKYVCKLLDIEVIDVPQMPPDQSQKERKEKEEAEEKENKHEYVD